MVVLLADSEMVMAAAIVIVGGRMLLRVADLVVMIPVFGVGGSGSSRGAGSPKP